MYLIGKEKKTKDKARNESQISIKFYFITLLLSIVINRKYVDDGIIEERIIEFSAREKKEEE